MAVYLEDGMTNEQKTFSDRKAVFLIGDSIRMGYCETVRRELTDVADVVYPSENCRCSQYILISLNGWKEMCDPQKVELVHFNCGHWDAAHWAGEDRPLNSPEVYQDNIRRIIRRLRSTFPNAKLMMATTTPMNPNGQMSFNTRTTQEIMAYNEAAVSAAEECGVPVNDLFALTQDWDACCYTDYCHFTEEAFERIGKQVADVIRSNL